MPTGFIPVGGAAAGPALVQNRTYTIGPGGAVSQSITFTSAVTAGNLLVVCIVTRGTNGPFSGPAGWTSLGTIDANGFNGGSGALFYKVATGSEGTVAGTFNTAAGTQRRIHVAEFSGAGGFVDSAQNDSHAATTALSLGAVDPTIGAPSLFVALA